MSVLLSMLAATILTNAWIVDGTGRDAYVGWVEVDGDRIVATGEGPRDVSGAIDLSGKTLLPGLTDMHVHLGELGQAKWMLKLLLAHGVTNVKDAGNRLGNLAGIRSWLRDETAVPHVFISGVTMNGSFSDLAFLKSGSETQRLLDDNLAFGVDFLKIHNWVSSQALGQIAEFAQTHDLYLTGHVPLGMTSIAALDAGMKILEHVRMRPSEVLDDPEMVARYPLDLIVSRRTLFWAFLDPDGRVVNQTLDAWSRRDFFFDPTLVVAESTTAGEKNAPGLELVSKKTLTDWRENVHRYGDDHEDVRRYGDQRVIGMARFVGMAHRKGVKVLTGTDTPVLWVVPGVSLHRELELLVELSGLSPVEAIHASTGVASEALRSPDRGTIAQGQRADLVIVRGNVAERIQAVQDVERVMLGGFFYEREALLEEAARLAAEHR